MVINFLLCRINCSKHKEREKVAEEKFMEVLRDSAVTGETEFLFSVLKVRK
jgi:hypothetical protein